MASRSRHIKEAKSEAPQPDSTGSPIDKVNITKSDAPLPRQRRVQVKTPVYTESDPSPIAKRTRKKKIITEDANETEHSSKNKTSKPVSNGAIKKVDVEKDNKKNEGNKTAKSEKVVDDATSNANTGANRKVNSKMIKPKSTEKKNTIEGHQAEVEEPTKIQKESEKVDAEESEEPKVTVKKGRGKTKKPVINEEKPQPSAAQKRKSTPTEDVEKQDIKIQDSPPTNKKARATKVAPTEKLNKFATDFSQLDFSLTDKEFTMKIASWNVAGLRALAAKGGMQYIEYEKPDIFCFQEIKCLSEEVPDEAKFKGYHSYWHSKPGGHAGVAIYSKVMPYNIEYGLGNEEQDDDARIITAEYSKFYLICVYVPNAGRKLITLPKRLRWDELFQAHLIKLNDKKPVIVCGDMNVSHTEIDLANPKSNKKSAGFTQEERDGMTKLLSLGFIDTFRDLYPNLEKCYTYWTYMANARQKNVGWRLDYFITSERMRPKVVDNVIRSKVLGSDHCPITLFLNI